MKLSSTKKSGWWKAFLSVHEHRYFRGFYIILLLLHLVLLLLPWLEGVQVPAPQSVRDLFSMTARIWPFPTFKMFSAGSLHIRQILMKSLEISVIQLYVIDLLPKIFSWRQSWLWRMLNILIVALMVAEIPGTLIHFSESAIPVDRLKLRVFSISLSFVVLCEILSIREQRTTRLDALRKHQRKSSRRMNGVFSWVEIVKHDKPGDCWIVIGRNVYDVSQFVDQHPGGPMIYDGAGGDCTALWHSYHPSYLTTKPPPEKHLIGSVRDYHSFYSYDGKFYEDLKKEVESKLPKRKWQSHWQLYIKAVILVPLYFYCVHWYVTCCTWQSAICLGAVASQVGVNIMHDGNHAAFSQSKWLSLIAGYGLDLTFSTSVVYRRSHNFGHHGCVNHYELDRSFDTTFPLMRLHPLQPRLPFHRYQHLYIWLIYGLANFGDLFGTFDEMYWMSNYPTRRGHITKLQLVMQAFVKLCWLFLCMIIPSYYHGWFNVFPIWFLHMVSHSYGYTLFFAVNHWTNEAGIVDNDTISEVNWGALQVVNSSNFDTKSTFWTHLAGGLNYQIEHHLFPQLSHTRLPEIQEIVKRHSDKYKLRYFEFPTFFKAIKGHYQLLKILGKQDSFDRFAK